MLNAAIKEIGDMNKSVISSEFALTFEMWTDNDSSDVSLTVDYWIVNLDSNEECLVGYSSNLLTTFLPLSSF